MGIAAAAFHWPPAIYWSSTRHEFFAAFEAFEQMNATPEGDSATK